MREIKFRAWHNKEKRFINLNGVDINFKGCANKGAIYLIYEQGVLRPLPLEDVELEQFTGLKDKNGVEIYEGDIVKANIQGMEFITSVVWGSKSHAWSLKCDRTNREKWGRVKYYKLPSNKNIEIIGNIHQDKELLK